MNHDERVQVEVRVPLPATPILRDLRAGDLTSRWLEAAAGAPDYAFLEFTGGALYIRWREDAT